MKTWNTPALNGWKTLFHSSPISRNDLFELIILDMVYSINCCWWRDNIIVDNLWATYSFKMTPLTTLLMNKGWSLKLKWKAASSLLRRAVPLTKINTLTKWEIWVLTKKWALQRSNAQLGAWTRNKGTRPLRNCHGIEKNCTFRFWSSDKKPWQSSYRAGKSSWKRREAISKGWWIRIKQ